MNRAAYLRLCILTSLRKRWGWVVGLMVLAGVGAAALSGLFQWGVVVALAALVGQISFIALSSYQRHKDYSVPWRIQGGPGS